MSSLHGTASADASLNAPLNPDSDEDLSFSLDEIIQLANQPNAVTTPMSTSMSLSMPLSAASPALAPPPPRSRASSLSHSASLGRQPLPPLRPDSVMYLSPSWAQTMPLPKLHDPLPSALPARASVVAQLPPALRQLGFVANRAGQAFSLEDDSNQVSMLALEDTPEFRSTISLLEPEGGSSDESGEFAMLDLDASFHEDIHLMFAADPLDHDYVDAETHDRSAISSSEATLVPAATPPLIEHAALPEESGHQGLSLAPMQSLSDEQLARGRQSAPKSDAPPDANRVSVVGDLPSFPRKSSHHWRHHQPMPASREAPSPTTPTRQEILGAAAGGGTILGKLKRALSGRRASPHSSNPPTPTRMDSDPSSSSISQYHHQRSNSIDQGIDTLRRALSRATSARRRKSPEDPPIPAPSSQAPNPYHNATAAATQQQQQQQYQVSAYGTIVYNNNNNNNNTNTNHHHVEYAQQHQGQPQFFSPPAESPHGNMGVLGGGGDELFMATLARGDADSVRSLDHGSQEVSTNPFATLAGLPLTVPTRTDSRGMASGAFLLSVPTSSGAGAGQQGPEMALTPPEMQEPVPAVFTLSRPSAAAAAPPLTPTRIEEQSTGYVTLQHTGTRGAPAPAVAAGGGADMLAQAREVAAYQTLRRGGR